MHQCCRQRRCRLSLRPPHYFPQRRDRPSLHRRGQRLDCQPCRPTRWFHQRQDLPRYSSRRRRRLRRPRRSSLRFLLILQSRHRFPSCPQGCSHRRYQNCRPNWKSRQCPKRRRWSCSLPISSRRPNLRLRPSQRPRRRCSPKWSSHRFHFLRWRHRRSRHDSLRPTDHTPREEGQRLLRFENQGDAVCVRTSWCKPPETRKGDGL